MRSPSFSRSVESRTITNWPLSVVDKWLERLHREGRNMFGLTESSDRILDGIEG